MLRIKTPSVIRNTPAQASFCQFSYGLIANLKIVTGRLAIGWDRSLVQNWFESVDLSEPMANLPVTIFKFAMSPFEDWQRIAWSGVFLITLGVLLLNVIARVLFKEGYK